MSALGLAPGAHRPLVELLLGILVLASFGLLVSLAVRRRDPVAASVSGLGVALVFHRKARVRLTGVTVVGAILLVTAAVANSALCKLGRFAATSSDHLKRRRTASNTAVPHDWSHLQKSTGRRERREGQSSFLDLKNGRCLGNPQNSKF